MTNQSMTESSVLTKVPRASSGRYMSALGGTGRHIGKPGGATVTGGTGRHVGAPGGGPSQVPGNTGPVATSRRMVAPGLPAPRPSNDGGRPRAEGFRPRLARKGKFAAVEAYEDLADREAMAAAVVEATARTPVNRISPERSSRAPGQRGYAGNAPSRRPMTGKDYGKLRRTASSGGSTPSPSPLEGMGVIGNGSPGRSYTQPQNPRAPGAQAPRQIKPRKPGATPTGYLGGPNPRPSQGGQHMMGNSNPPANVSGYGPGMGKRQHKTFSRRRATESYPGTEGDMDQPLWYEKDDLLEAMQEFNALSPYAIEEKINFGGASKKIGSGFGRMRGWAEGLHPRDAMGRFASKGGAGARRVGGAVGGSRAARGLKAGAGMGYAGGVYGASRARAKGARGLAKFRGAKSAARVGASKRYGRLAAGDFNIGSRTTGALAGAPAGIRSAGGRGLQKARVARSNLKWGARKAAGRVTGSRAAARGFAVAGAARSRAGALGTRASRAGFNAKSSLAYKGARNQIRGVISGSRRQVALGRAQSATYRGINKAQGYAGQAVRRVPRGKAGAVLAGAALGGAALVAMRRRKGGKKSRRR